jgi:hypothetical protein
MSEFLQTLAEIRRERYSAQPEEVPPKYFKDYILTEEPQDEIGLIYINGTCVLNEGNVLLLTGPPKSRKTRLASVLINQAQLKTAYIDTQQGRKHSWRLGRHILIADVFHLRGQDQEEIMRVINEIVLCKEYRLLVIDNVRDLLRDFNSVEQSGALELFFKKISEQIATICILHENKNSKRSQGHLGYSFEKVAQTTVRVCLADVEDPGKGSFIECVLSRDEPLTKAFLSDSGVLSNDSMLKVGGRSMSQDDLFRIIGDCEYSHDELVNKIAEVFGVSPGTAKNSFTAIRKACPNMITERKEGKRKMFFVSLPTSDR